MKKSQSIIESTIGTMSDRSYHNLKMAVLDYIISKLLKDNLMVDELQIDSTRINISEELHSVIDDVFRSLIELPKTE